MKSATLVFRMALLVVISFCYGCAGLTSQSKSQGVGKHTWGIVTSPHLNVRAGPSMQHEVVGYVQSGDWLQVTGEQGRWVAIDFGLPDRAYVGRNHIQIDDNNITADRVLEMGQGSRQQSRQELGQKSGEEFEEEFGQEMVDMPGGNIGGGANYSWWLDPVATLANFDDTQFAGFTLMAELWQRYCEKLLAYLRPETE